MRDTASDEKGFAGHDVDILAIDKPSRRAGYPVNRLVPAFMVVRNGHPGVRRESHLKHIDEAGCLVLALEKSEFDRTHVNDLGHDIPLLSWQNIEMVIF